MEKYSPLLIQLDTSILSALKQMDAIQRKLLIVIRDEKVFSLLSIGDIQRAILGKCNLKSQISTILRANVRIANIEDDLEAEKERMRLKRNEFMPVVDNEGKLKEVIFWDDLFKKENTKHSQLNLPLVIMAGGKGSRLKPLTNVLPKPLIPIGDKTILEEIMDRFAIYGCSKVFMSVNFKAEFIKYYFSDKHYDITYFQEDKPLGTAGSLYLLKGQLKDTFIVSNCDIIIDQDLNEIYKYHKEQKNKITIVSVLKHHKIPYGTLDTGTYGQLQTLTEKPELTFQINSGVYIVEPEVLEQIPENNFFHITELIEKIKTQGEKIGVFPASEGSWKDIGEWNEYLSNYADN